MSEKRVIVGDEISPKRQKFSGEQEQGDEEQCIVCLRSEEELLAADCPLREEHGCPRCKKSSWRICEECEEHHLSRKCPLCRGEYAPMLLYPFPDLNPDTENSDRMQEVKIFRAKMSLLLKIVEGSNTAMYLPAQGLMRFLLPQLPGSEYNTENSSDVRFLEVDIPMPPERMASEVFSFTDKVWDELETAQGIIDETLYNESQVVNMGNEASENIVYTPVTVDEIPASANYQNKVNDTFFDSVERINYKIEAVCASSVHGNDKLFFKYVKVPQNTLSSEIGGEERLEMEANECDYSPCDELLTADWVTWSSDQEEWIQCCSCNKWRKIPKHSTSEGVVKLKDLPDDWTCGMAGWLEGKCEVPEEEYSNTVSITEAINGLPVANNVSTSEDGRQHTAGDVSDDSVPINNSHQSDTVNDNQEAPQQNDEVAETDTNIVYTVDLPTAVRNIISSLKSNIGNKLLTRLSPETTQSILTMATQH